MHYELFRLSDERGRWESQLKSCEPGFKTALGDAIIGGMVVAYFGRLKTSMQEKVMNLATDILSSRNIKVNEDIQEEKIVVRDSASSGKPSASNILAQSLISADTWEAWSQGKSNRSTHR